MSLWKITDKGPSKVKEIKFKQEKHLIESVLEKDRIPAVENRGEGIFIQLRAQAVKDWFGRLVVKERIDNVMAGRERWVKDRKTQRVFPGGPYVLLHTLSHLLIQSLSMRCG